MGLGAGGPRACRTDGGEGQTEVKHRQCLAAFCPQVGGVPGGLHPVSTRGRCWLPGSCVLEDRNQGAVVRSLPPGVGPPPHEHLVTRGRVVDGMRAEQALCAGDTWSAWLSPVSCAVAGRPLCSSAASGDRERRRSLPGLTLPPGAGVSCEGPQAARNRRPPCRDEGPSDAASAPVSGPPLELWAREGCWGAFILFCSWP